MNEEVQKLSQLIESGAEMLDVYITLEDILEQDITTPLKILFTLLDNERFAIYFRERVNIHFTGFNNMNKELWEIPDVRNFIFKLDEEFPYWFYFLSKKNNSLFIIFQSYMIPFLSSQMNYELNRPNLREHFVNKWVPALYEICEYADISEDESRQMCNRVFSQLINMGIA